MRIGRIVSTALIGLVFGAFVGLDLVLFGVAALDSPVIVVLAVVMAVVGGVPGALAARRLRPQVPRSIPQPPPPGAGWLPPPSPFGG